MSTEATPAAERPAAWPVLGVNERRVLGVLIEKAKTTPDAYPMSLNALTTGCNQKSNRDPILDLNNLDVEEALAAEVASLRAQLADLSAAVRDLKAALGV